MDAHERRQRMRAILTGDRCVAPASVFDPLSARAAAALGFDVAMLAGSIASAVVVGAPDLVVLTLTELAEQVRRITRAGAPPLLVDADHGYGNALGVMRCVQELESAGVAALTIEDTLLPRPFGATSDSLIATAEAVGKLRAAVEARSDPTLVVLARTSALRIEGADSCRARVAAYTDTGVDGIFLVGVQTREELERLRGATPLPFVLGSGAAALQDRAYLADQGVRMMLQGHAPFQAAVKAMWDTLTALHDGAMARDLQSTTASAALLADLSAQESYDRAIARYLGPTSA